MLCAAMSARVRGYLVERRHRRSRADEPQDPKLELGGQRGGHASAGAQRWCPPSSLSTYFAKCCGYRRPLALLVPAALKGYGISIP